MLVPYSFKERNVWLCNFMPLLPYYLFLHQFHRMGIGKEGKVESVSHHLDHCMAVLVHQVRNVERPLFSEA